MRRRGATGLLGVLPLDKPAGMTSHDVVARVRRATGEGRVGHAGTLDPMATGLLVVLVGAYARLAPFLTSSEKVYDATIAFGSETDTDDAEGAVTRKAAVPEEVLDERHAREVLAGFVGRSLQTPPAYSAIKVAGMTAHRAARSGSPLELEPREIVVSDATLVGIDATARSWRVVFTVSKGTYVRALARDIGRACGSAAHLSGLRRTASGSLTLADAHTLDEAVGAAEEGRLEALFADPLAALALPTAESFDGAASAGRPLPVPEGAHLAEGSCVAVTRDGRLAAIYRVGEDALLPMVVLPAGDAA